MCFGYRISSLFQLDTLNIPIQNIKSPKNAKMHARTYNFHPNSFRQLKAHLATFIFLQVTLEWSKRLPKTITKGVNS